MNHSKQEQALALAGLLQASRCVEMLATLGNTEKNWEKPLIDSLFVFDAPDTASVYGSVQELRPGLTLLLDLLRGQNANNMGNIASLAMNTIILNKALSSNQDMLSILGSRLEHVANHRDIYNDENPIYRAIAGIYQDTLSTLKFRIKVSGQVALLQRNDIAQHIRCLLLCAVRSAMLWRQLGGRRWHLIIGKGSLIKAAEQLLRGKV
jgi:high frequency lysogenization protein